MKVSGSQSARRVRPSAFVAACLLVSISPAAAQAAAPILVATDSGTTGVVHALGDASGTVVGTFSPFSGFMGGVRVASGDINGDGIADIVAGTGQGSNVVQVLNGAGGPAPASFFAYDAAFTGGVYVAAGDVNGDGFADIITGAGPGAAPHVKVFSGSTGATLHSFFAFGASFTGGVRVAAGDVTGDGIADIIVGTGPGAGQVRVFDPTLGIAATDDAGIGTFLAFGPGYTGGVFVAAGDVNGDGLADIATGTDSGTAARVKVFDGALGATTLFDFLPFGAGFNGGVRVAAGDVAGDGIADIITSPGSGGDSLVKVFSGSTGGELSSFTAFTGFSGGVFVAGVTPVCGNGGAESPEECDDANTADGDGCDATCRVEASSSTTSMPATEPEAVCDSLPRTTCFEGAPGKSTVVIQFKGPGKDKLSFKFGKGAAYDLAEVGEPATGQTSYAFCLYGVSAAMARGVASSLLVDAPVAGGEGWKATAKGAVYSSKTGNAAGVTKLILKSGADGKSLVLVKMGKTFASPGLPLAGGPIAQVVNSRDQCWSTSFTAPKKNTEKNLVAKGPALD